jgi:enoyl-CoA hydratase
MTALGPSSTVTYETKDRIGYITLNRPDKRNALNMAVWRAVGDATAQAEADKDVRVIILRGAGKSFCAGLDLSAENDILHLLTGDSGAVQKVEFFRIVREAQQIHCRLEELRVPVIAAIHGHCLGAGLELVLCCDMRFCTADTQFGLPEARLALITDVGGLQRLPKVVGPGHAREIAFRGHRFDADKARRIGLVNDTFDDKETMDAAVLEIAREIAENPPLAVQGAKEVLLFDYLRGTQRSLEYNAARNAMIVPSEDLGEAFSAYMQKRKAAFKGA